MNYDDIRRYEKDLLQEVQGFRMRKRVKKEFHRFLEMLETDVYDVNYDTICNAFGSPKDMAELLIYNMMDPPKPLHPKQKFGMVVIACVVVLFLATGLYLSQEVPETVLTISDGHTYSPTILSQVYASQLVDEFSHQDVTWTQSKEFDTYLLLLHNTNQVPTSVEVRYSDHQSPHTFEIPAGEQRALLVEDARATTHTVAFSTDDGTLSGTVQVYVSLPVS